MATKIAIGSDHAGYRLKNRLKNYLDKKKISYIDLGALKYNKTDDYTDYALKVSQFVRTHKTKGIMICGSGIGSCITANKVRGVRAATANDLYSAKMSRRDNDANLLCLGARTITTSKAKRIVGVWLKERFLGGRHKRRVNKIEYIEKHSDIFSN